MWQLSIPRQNNALRYNGTKAALLEMQGIGECLAAIRAVHSPQNWKASLKALGDSQDV